MTDTAPAAPRWIDYVPLDDIPSATRNPKAHDDDSIDASVGRFGYVEAMVLDERTGRLVAGHGRRDNLIRRRDRGEEPPDGIIVLPDGRWAGPVQRGWRSRSDEEADAYVVTSNRLVEAGGWNTPLLAEMLSEMADIPDGLVGVGFTPLDIDALLDSLREPAAPFVPLSDPDAVPEPPAEPVSRPGDVWRCGRHLVTCGDSTDPVVYDRIVTSPVDLVWTDPPYGVGIVGGSHALPPERRRAAGEHTIDNDDLSIDDLTTFLQRSLGLAAERTKPGGVWFVAAPSGPQMLAFCRVLDRLGIWRQTLVWVKNSLVLSRHDYHYRHEALFFGWRPGAGHHRPEGRDNDSVWLYDRPARSDDHPTMKPVAMIERSILTHTDEGAVVLDPFGGSGSTLLAAERTGRTARLIEKDARYVDVIVRRWQEHTGGVAERLISGDETGNAAGSDPLTS